MLVLDKIENMLQELALLDPEKLDLASVNDLSDVLNTLASIRQGNVDQGVIQDYAGEHAFLGEIQKHIGNDIAERLKQAAAMNAAIQKVRDLMESDEAQIELLAVELELWVEDIHPQTGVKYPTFDK